MVLMVGTLVGGFVQTGEIFSTGALSYAPDTVPNWIQARSGSFLMVLAVCFIVFPASLVEVMTQVRTCALARISVSCRMHRGARAERAVHCTPSSACLKCTMESSTTVSWALGWATEKRPAVDARG